MPPKNTKRPRKITVKNWEGYLREKRRLGRKEPGSMLKSFQQPTIKESLASQGMTLRGHTLRAGQGDMREGTYMELMGSDNENETRENPPPPPPPKNRENTSSQLIKFLYENDDEHWV